MRLNSIALLRQQFRAKIHRVLKLKWIGASILVGIITSWLIKDSLTPLLLAGKSFHGRSFGLQVGILALFVVIASVVFLSIWITIYMLDLGKAYLAIKSFVAQFGYKTTDWLSPSRAYQEIKQTLQVLIIRKGNVRAFFSSPYRVILILIFAVLFLPHAFILVNDINLIIAYEVDSGEMMQGIADLFKNGYNMNVEFGTQAYGWTYFSINYFLLIPIYVAMALKLIQDPVYVFTAIRLIFFTIGLGSVVVFHEVARQTLRHNSLSFFSTLLFIAYPGVFRYFYFVHPETTGLLFLFLGMLCLFRFHEGQAKDARWYVVGLVCLVLSALSKQVFFFTALSVLFLFMNSYCFHKGMDYYGFLKSRKLIEVFLKTIVLSLFIFFLIHPFAFLQPNSFIAAEQFLTSAHSSLSILEAWKLWALHINATPLIFVSILSCPFTLMFIFMQKGISFNKMLYTVNLICSICVLLLICTFSRLFIYNGYLLPVYPLFILNVFGILVYSVRNISLSVSKTKLLISAILLISMFSLLVLTLARDVSVSLPMGYSRFMYQESTVYRVYVYIDKNIPRNSRIVFDNSVAIPEGKGIASCSYWAGCGTDYIEQFNPDYVIFNEDYRIINGGLQPATIRLKKYVTDHTMKLVATIDNVEVYKK